MSGAGLLVCTRSGSTGSCLIQPLESDRQPCSLTDDSSPEIRTPDCLSFAVNCKIWPGVPWDSAEADRPIPFALTANLAASSDLALVTGWAFLTAAEFLRAVD